MNWDDFRSAFNEANKTIDIADRFVADMARIVAGRLRKSNASSFVLCTLKKELENFNMHTKTWKE